MAKTRDSVTIEYNQAFNRYAWVVISATDADEVVDFGLSRTRVGAKFAAWKATRND